MQWMRCMLVPALLCMAAMLCAVGVHRNGLRCRPIKPRNYTPTSLSAKKYFVQASNVLGRYSNMRMALLRAASIAESLNRTLIYAPFGSCLNDEAVEDLFDMTSIGAVPAVADLRFVCKPRGTTPMLMRRISPYSTQRATNYVLPKTLTRDEMLAMANFYWLPYRFRHHFEYAGMMWRPHYAENDTWTTSALRNASLRNTATCLGVHDTFTIGLEWDEFLPRFSAVERRIKPSKPIIAAVNRYLIKHKIKDVAFAGIHLRLTDIGGKQHMRGLDCSTNVFDIITTIKKYSTTYPGMPTVLATDDINSRCAKVVRDALQPITVQSDTWDPSSCREAAFVQEVLGHSTVFVGIKNSTFSRSIEGIRRNRNQHSIPARFFAA